MKYTILGEHQKFFRQHHYIEFDHLLTEVQVDELTKAIQGTLCSRLGITQENLSLRSFEDILNAGHDLFRQDFTVRKIASKKNFAQIVFELSDEKPVRLAYDQVLCTHTTSFKLSPRFDLKKEYHLKDLSGLQGSVYGLMLCLQPNEKASLTPPFANTKGNGIYFSDQLPLSLSAFHEQSNALYLLIVYSGAKALVLQHQFFPYAYKQLGYATGDLLKDDLHPVLYR